MTQLKSLTFAPLPKLTAADPVIQRRNKLIVRLQQQVALVRDPNFTLTRQKWIADDQGVKQLREVRKRVRAWWRTDTTGAVVPHRALRRQAHRVEKGKAAIAVGKKEKARPDHRDCHRGCGGRRVGRRLGANEQDRRDDEGEAGGLV